MGPSWLATNQAVSLTPILGAPCGRSSAAPVSPVHGTAGGVALAGALARLFMWRPLGGAAVGIAGGLLVSALTDSCTMARVLAKLPYNNAGATCDVASVLQDMTRRTAPVSLAAG